MAQPGLKNPFRELENGLVKPLPVGRQADFVIEHASRFAWLLWAVAAGLVGIVMLVLQNSGFGWIDLRCPVCWQVAPDESRRCKACDDGEQHRRIACFYFIEHGLQHASCKQ